jgi:hypothetical protein
MKGIYLIIHLGLGDQIMTCGMVRHFLEHGYKVKICARENHKATCEFLYRDVSKDLVSFEYVKTDNPREIWATLPRIESEGYEVRPLATYKVPTDMWNWFTVGPGKEMANWTHTTYIQADVNPLYMKTKFKIVRDLEREQEVFNKFNLKKGEYIFVHESKERDRRINYPDVGLPVFNPDDHYKEIPVMFDYLTIIENAKEVHCMTSSYAMMIELTEIGDKTKNFLHTLNIPGYLTIRESYLSYSDKLWTFVQTTGPSGAL